MFGLNDNGVDDRILDPVCCDPANSHRVSDQLLRWHFRQSVLANIGGAGEPVFEHGFSLGTGEIRDETIAELQSNIEEPGEILSYQISFILCRPLNEVEDACRHGGAKATPPLQLIESQKRRFP